MPDDDDARSRLLAALQHPLRRRILRLMKAREDSISPTELAAELEEPLGDVAYHVRVLAQCDALKKVEEKPVRGATQHFYRFFLEVEWAREMLREEED